MLHSIFIYQKSSGVPIWEHSFEENASQDSLIMFSSFFAAIQNFIHEIVKGENIGLKNLDLGIYQVDVSNVGDLDLEIVTVVEAADKKERNSIIKIHDKITNVLLKNKTHFDWTSWDGQVSRFKFLDLDFLSILQELRTIDKIQIIPKQIEDKIIANKSHIIEEQVQIYGGEFEEYKNQLKKAETFPEKFGILETLSKLAQKLNNPLINENFEQVKKKITHEFEDTKTKALMYIKQAKTNIIQITNNMHSKNFDESKVRDIFLPLYSLSGKLRILGQNSKAEEYKAIAQAFMNKEINDINQRFEIIQNIMKMPEDMNFYLKNN